MLMFWALWFSVDRCERTTYTQAVLRPVPLHRQHHMGEEILHPDRQPARAAQQGERGERSSQLSLRICLLACVGEKRRQLLSAALGFDHKLRVEEGSYPGWHGAHSYNSAAPDPGCMEEVTGNYVHPPGVLWLVFMSATTSACVIAALNSSKSYHS